MSHLAGLSEPVREIVHILRPPAAPPSLFLEVDDVAAAVLRPAAFLLLRALPDLPTIAESGVAGYEVSAWFGLFAPARVPPAVIGMLNAEARKAVLNPDVVRRMEIEGTDVVGNPATEFAAEVKKEFDKWRGLVKSAGLKL